MSRKGFTLIELLVVMVIIAILAAILFPVFAKAREKARATHCVSNQKQIMVAMLMYASDHKGITPPTGLPMNSPDVDTGALHHRLRGYYGDTRIWKCPTIHKADVGYMASCRGGIADIDASANPSRWAYLVDGFGTAWNRGATTKMPTANFWWPAPCGTEISSSVPVRHGDGVNVGYVDGHVEHQAVTDVGGIDVDGNKIHVGYGYIANSVWY